MMSQSRYTVSDWLSLSHERMDRCAVGRAMNALIFPYIPHANLLAHACSLIEHVSHNRSLRIYCDHCMEHHTCMRIELGVSWCQNEEVGCTAGGRSHDAHRRNA
jgi:hypothetical protein